MKKTHKGIDESILYFSIMEEIAKHSISSDIALGIFSCSRLALEGESSMICFAMDKNDKFIGEQIISSGYESTISSNINLIKSFSQKSNPYQIAVACNYNIATDEDFINQARECDILFAFLLNHNIKLRNYILCDKFDFETLI